MAPIPSEIETVHQSAASDGQTLLVFLTSVSGDVLNASLRTLSVAFAGGTVLVAVPDLYSNDVEEAGRRYENLKLLTESTSAVSSGNWVLTAADFLNIYKLAQQQGAGACLLLGPDSHSLSAEAVRHLATAIANGGDLAVPRYDTKPREGLVNSALLYPVSRAVFGGRARFPLALDVGMSIRMASRLATVAQKFTALNQNDALIWPVAEAAAAGYSIAEVHAGPRTFPQPVAADLNTLLAQITSSLFTEIETHAAFWQRARVSPSSLQPNLPNTVDDDAFPDVGPMLDAFRSAYTNLHEIWSLVLPPNSLLGLKRLSQLPPESFRMSDSLWARTVYDFILAYRLRTINRGHLLGALTPLYLAWVASHILLVRSGVAPERHIEEVVQAFETDKAYLVSRWRWPDRFNP